MATALMVIGLIAMLAALLLLIIPIFFGTDSYIITLPLAKYAFYTSSLTFIGFLFKDASEKEYFTEDSGIFCIIISFIAFCFTLVHIVRSVYAQQVKKRNEKKELARQTEIKEIQKQIQKLQEEKNTLESELGSRYLLTHFTQLLESCGGNVLDIEEHPEMLKTRTLVKEIAQREQEISLLTQKI